MIKRILHTIACVLSGAIVSAIVYFSMLTFKNEGEKGYIVLAIAAILWVAFRILLKKPLVYILTNLLFGFTMMFIFYFWNDWIPLIFMYYVLIVYHVDLALYFCPPVSSRRSKMGLEKDDLLD